MVVAAVIELSKRIQVAVFARADYQSGLYRDDGCERI